MATDVLASLKEFVRKMEEEHASEEERIRETYVRFSKCVEKQRTAIRDTYNDFFQWIMDRIHGDEGVEVEMFLKAWMASKRPDLFADVMKQALPQLKTLEADDVMNVNVKVVVKEDTSQYLFGNTPAYFYDPLDA